ncbi:2Fe-2S iron-sulfur cluster-binding protein [Solimonas terrae]|uniref:2Fe-2S iron-sulfur cluster binding domain-containing protein n=1 Tax=Solimonas terrae TaxID=1396819 RepID=A0A6M2BU52_9GAMM|nr:2Fe-2S iron-sulfur cluster-binding protein [Solimonas terrae]NGY05741.1 2Fe-2S iron-sulfur cluster binding domain-containing protein [Solimonas terrae]
MPKIVFIQPDGSSQTVEAPVGQSLMEAATNNFVRGIVGECGGSCSCATCHLYIDEAWYAKLPPRDEMEEAMIEGAIDPGPTSRLGCQVLVKDELDGIVAHVPKAQF